MQNKTLIPLLLFLFVLSSCTKKEGKISFETIHKSEKDFDCETTDCPEISIQQLVAFSSSKEMETVVETINRNISDHIIYSISSYDDEESPESVEDAAKLFISRYKEDKREFPDMVAHYTASIESEKTHDSDNLLSIRMFTHLYTGGAHGYSSVSYLNFDPKTGDGIAIEQILVDVEDFINFVEIKFRRAYDIPENSDINATRFMFEGNTFILPSSMGFDDKNMLFTYNPYDIAPYSEGLIELKIPINEIQPFININLN